MTAAGMVEDYVRLCRDPVRDLKRWIAEDKRSRIRSYEPTTRLPSWGEHVRTEKQQTDAVARAVGIRDKPLHEMRGRLDAPLEKRELPDRVSSRPRSGVAGDGGLRSFRAEGGAGLTPAAILSLRADVSAAFQAEHAGLLNYYAARIEAAKRGASPAAIMAAIRAIADEQTAALRNLADRRHAAEAKEREKQPTRPARAPRGGGIHAP